MKKFILFAILIGFTASVMSQSWKFSAGGVITDGSEKLSSQPYEYPIGFNLKAIHRVKKFSRYKYSALGGGFFYELVLANSKPNDYLDKTRYTMASYGLEGNYHLGDYFYLIGKGGVVKFEEFEYSTGRYDLNEMTGLTLGLGAGVDINFSQKFGFFAEVSNNLRLFSGSHVNNWGAQAGLFMKIYPSRQNIKYRRR